MSRRTKKPKREFSKLILYVVGAVTVGVTAFTLIMVWKTENLEPLAYLIPAIFAELATATGVVDGDLNHRFSARGQCFSETAVAAIR